MNERVVPAAVLADYVSSVRFEQLPGAVVDWTTALVGDSLGCMLGALALPEARSILAAAEARSGLGSAFTIGGGPSSVGSAVFCNSQLANLLDFDDTYDSRAPFHPGCMIIPAALAVGQSSGASGREFLTAVTVAYEVALRVGGSLGNALWNGGGPWAWVGELAAAIAAARLHRLDAPQIRALLSIVAPDEGSFSQQLRRRAKADVPATRHFGTLKANFGSLAQTGVWAARKARAGLTGVPGLLERTFPEWYRTGLPDSGFESLTTHLGEEYFSTKVSLKPTPSCRWTHAPITAAWDALNGRRLDASHVSRIRVIGVPRLERGQWSTPFDAQFSVPCALALAVSGVEPGPEWYAGGAYRSQPILDLAAKVVQEADPGAEEAEMHSGRIGCRVEIELTGGQKLLAECEAAKGSVDNPLTGEERRAKFDANTAHLSAQCRDVSGAVGRLAQSSTLEELNAALAAAG